MIVLFASTIRLSAQLELIPPLHPLVSPSAVDNFGIFYTKQVCMSDSGKAHGEARWLTPGSGSFHSWWSLSDRKWLMVGLGLPTPL
jgi:hypothetical protein